jgi:hypothetical protein
MYDNPGIQNPTFNSFAIWNSLESRIQTSEESGIIILRQFLESGIHNRSGIRNPSSGIQKEESGIQVVESGIQVVESGIQGGESGIQGKESGIHGVHNPSGK